MRSLVHGRWLESQKQTDYKKYDKLCTGNAKSYYAKKDGYARGKTPKLGAIACWSGGSQGFGHVAFVEDIYSNGDFLSSNSGYGGGRFFTKRITKASGYSFGSQYKFQGFIYPPVDFTLTDVTPTVSRDENKDQLKVKTTELRVRENHNTKANIIGVAKQYGIYNYYEMVKDGGYDWYRIADKQWIANNGKWLEIYPKKKPDETDKEKIARLEKELKDANSEIEELNNKIGIKEAELEAANLMINKQKQEIADKNKKIVELEKEKSYKFKYEAPKTGDYRIHLNEKETLYIK